VAHVGKRPETAEELAKHPRRPADLFFDRLEMNGDGVLTPDEIPERMRPFLLLGGVKLPEDHARGVHEAVRGDAQAFPAEAVSSRR
jgi:hypothetical protein